MSATVVVINRPLVLALGLVGAGAVALVLAFAGDAPVAAAVVSACSSPGIIIVMYEALRTLDERLDAETRRSALIALAVLLVPFLVLVATAARLGVRVSSLPR